MQVIDRRMSQFSKTLISKAQEAASPAGESNSSVSIDGEGLFLRPILEGNDSDFRGEGLDSEADYARKALLELREDVLITWENKWSELGIDESGSGR